MKKTGRKSKYHSHVEPRLFEVECWARDGLIDEQIAKKLGVSYSTLKEYKNLFPAFSAALKRGKEIVDAEVENALLKRALGYEYREKKYAQVEMSEAEYFLRQKAAVNTYKLDHPEASLEELKAVEFAVSRYKLVLVEEKTKEVPADTTAQIFWLKNRKPDVWRDKKETELSGDTSLTVVFDPGLDDE